MRSYKDILEAKGTVTVKKDKYLVFPDGTLTSLDKNSEVIVVNAKGAEAKLSMDGPNPYADVDNRYDKEFKDLDDLVNWMNKEGFTEFVGAE